MSEDGGEIEVLIELQREINARRGKLSREERAALARAELAAMPGQAYLFQPAPPDPDQEEERG